MMNHSNKDYEFIHEELPNRTKRDWKWVLRFVLLMLSGGVILGLATCVTIIYFSPYVETYTKGSPKEEKEIESEQYSIENSNIESLISDAIEDKVSGIDDYKEIYEQLKGVAQEASRYMVIITGTSAEGDWPDKQDIVTSGMIVSKSTNIIMITDLEDINGADHIKITFFNGKTYAGEVMEKDSTLGIATIKVPGKEIEEQLYEDIKTAEFEKRLSAGENIILMGNPYGTDSYVAYGNITSTSNSINITDGKCHLLTTDISTTEGMNGFVINLDGKVVGIVNHTLRQKSMDGIVSALLISDAETTIKNMIDGKKKICFGVDGADVTEEVIEVVDESMPYGVYVKDTIINSPAYNAGILSGDIIVDINGMEIKSLEDIMSVLAKCESGQEIGVEVMRRGKDEYKSIEYRVIV